MLEPMENAEYTRKQSLYRAPAEQAWALFQRAPCVRFAAVTDDGRALVRSLSAVVFDGGLCFHGRDRGEKLALIGREVMASCEEVIAQIPSYWIHPDHACPVTTYCLSASAEGLIEPVLDLERKAQILSALMRRFQPEGGYAEIAPADPRYATALEPLLVAELRPRRLSAKFKLGQNRSKAQIERVLEGLWRRGTAGDLRAIGLVRAAHPARPAPTFLCGPEASELCVAPDERDAEAVARLLEGQYWTEGFTPEQLAQAQLGSTAWVVARDPHTRAVLASARAVSDCARFGYVLDVIVRPELRRCGLGRALMQLLLDHPALRRVAQVGLATRDAQAFYGRLGFEPARSAGASMRRSRT